MSEQLPSDSQDRMIVFGAKQIRRMWHDDQWFFSIVDIIGALTDSENPSDYWYRMKQREKESSGIELSTLCRQLKLTSSDGKAYKTECVNIEAAFRVIQSIPSPKAEPFKRWLAEVGYQRVQEIENPELAQQRMRKLYQDKGYPNDWIEKRVRGIAAGNAAGPPSPGRQGAIAWISHIRTMGRGNSHLTEASTLRLDDTRGVPADDADRKKIAPGR